jgi:heptosyltransferase-1
LPVLRLLKRHLPASEIYWWIDVRLAPLLEADPDLAGLLLFDRKRWAGPRHWPELWRSVQRARQSSFDWAIDLQGLARSGLFAWLARAEVTVGLAGAREVSSAAYDLIAPVPKASLHAVDRYLEVLSLLNVPVSWDFDWLPLRAQIASDLRTRFPVSEGRWILFQPGARWANKRWPIEHFVVLAKKLLAAYPNHRIAILGGAEETGLGQTIQQVDPLRCLNLTGKLSLPEMVEWIRFGEIMVTNDTGPMHVAAALGKPIVPIFGPTDPARTGPYHQVEQALQLTSLPCVPCLSSRCQYVKPIECLRALSPETVFAAVNPRQQP